MKPALGLMLVILGLVVGVGLRLLHYYPSSATIGSDDQRYVIVARELFGEHESDITPVYYQRIIWRLVLKVYDQLFGLTLRSSVYLMAFLFIVTYLSVASAARVFHSQAAMAGSLAFFATHPLLVSNDLICLPDGLAVALLALAVALVARNSRTRESWPLLLAAFVLGIEFGVKGYFILSFLPLVIYILTSFDSVKSRIKILAFASVCFVAGCAIKPLLLALDGGGMSDAIASYTDYSQRLLEIGVNTNPVFQLASRFIYVKWFLDCGGGFAWASLLGVLALAWPRKRSPLETFLLLNIGMYGVFLFACPASFSPLVFVTKLPRYMTILMPFLALAFGVFLDSLADWCTSNSRQRWFTAAVVMMVFVMLGSGIFQPQLARRRRLSNPFLRSTNSPRSTAS